MTHWLVVLITSCAWAVSSWLPRDDVWRDASPHGVRFVDVDRDVRLEVLDWGGSGVPVVLLAGSGMSAHIFDEFAPKLAAAAHVYGLSRRGYGASTRSASGYDNQRLSDDIVAAVESLGLDRPVLVGHSMAGGEITTVANQYSDRLRGLVYLDALGDPRDWPASSNAYMALVRNLPPSPGNRPPSDQEMHSFDGYRAWQRRTQRMAFPESELRQMFTTNPDGSMGGGRVPIAIYRALGDGEVRRDYSKVRVPVLAFLDYPRMEEGLLRPAEWLPDTAEGQAALRAFVDATKVYVDRWIANLKRSVPDARLIDLSGAGHFLFITRERDVLYEVGEFLKRVE